MAEIRPFRGLRYNQDKISDLSQVISPPYDVIPAEQQEAYHERNPYNIIRLELGKTFPTDTEDNNRYTRAAEYLKQWMEEGILMDEDQPVFYICQDIFECGGVTYKRNGLVTALKATPYKEGIVLPHEDTLPKAKVDRFSMLDSCKTNFSGIFALYQDETGAIPGLLEPITKQPPMASAVDDEGVRHNLWIIRDSSTIASIQSAFADKKIYIADGHHRYETACKFSEERGSRYGWVMTSMFEMTDPGLIILPTYRLLRNIGPTPWDMLEANFQRETFSYPELDHSPEKLDEFLGIMAKKASLPCFGYYAGGTDLELLTLRSMDAVDCSLADHPKAYRELDATILHELILKPAFGLGNKEITSEGYVSYTRDASEAWKSVHDGESKIAMFLNGTRLDQVTKVAAAGARMPQKSTFFWPKLITGMIMCRLEQVG